MSTIEERLETLGDLESIARDVWLDQNNAELYGQRRDKAKNAIAAEWNTAIKVINGLICSHHCHAMINECKTCVWEYDCTKHAGWKILAKMEGTDV